MGILYIIATPIGNREDITLRAIKTLGSIDVLLCEDTRHTGQLLQYIKKLAVNFQFKKPKLLSYQEHNESERIPEVLALLLDEKHVGLVSDAGTPLISDPGFKLVSECHRQHIPVSPIPGASSLTASLSVSGMPTDKFMFLGYLPKKIGKRRKQFKEIKKLKDEKIVKTFILFETPHRINKTLEEIKEELGNIEISITNELTKMHEKVWRGNVSEVYESVENIKGECVIIV